MEVAKYSTILSLMMRPTQEFMSENVFQKRLFFNKIIRHKQKLEIITAEVVHDLLKIVSFSVGSTGQLFLHTGTNADYEASSSCTCLKGSNEIFLYWGPLY